MNLMQLKYAVEVEKAKSISKAAENLFMGQPNLSRAIKELEESLGITIFSRTPKGMAPTLQGEEFLQYAKQILAQVDAVEMYYKDAKEDKQRFSVSVPRASYIACAFTEFTKKLDDGKCLEVFYHETNSMRAINNILQADYKLGIIRYQRSFEQYFSALLHEKDLKSELITEFSYKIVVSKHSKLAKKEVVSLKDLEDYTEISHADPYVPSLPFIDAKKAELSEFVNKRIFIFERGSQMDILSNMHTSFMWVSPIPQRLLDLYDLVELECFENQKIYKDVLVYKNGYKFTKTDELFISEVNKLKP